MMNKDELHEQFSPLLDDELDEEARAAIEAELSQDSDLLRELDGFKRVDALFRALPRADAPDDFEQRVRTALRPGVLQFARTRLPKFHLAPALASAAGLLVVSGFVFYMMNGSRFSPQTEMATMMDAQPSIAADRAAPAAAAEESADRLSMGRAAPPETFYQLDEATPMAGAELDAPVVAEPLEKGMPAREGGNAEASELQNRGRAPSKAETPAAAAPSPPTSRHVADRSFRMSFGVWVQEGYAEHETTIVEPDSEAFAALVKAHPELADLTSFGVPVIFAVDDKWYTLSARASE